MENSSTAQEGKATEDQEMALKEYQILEQAVGAANTAQYAVAAIFMGGVVTGSAILIPKIAQQNCGWALCGYLVASAVIVLCMQFWFWGIHLRWRAIIAIMYHRLEERENDLPFQAHRRIHEFYESEKNGFEWPDRLPPPWYTDLMGTLGPLTPWRGGMNRWWRCIVRTITLAYVVTWVLALCRCIAACPYTRLFLQRLLGFAL